MVMTMQSESQCSPPHIKHLVLNSGYMGAGGATEAENKCCVGAAWTGRIRAGGVYICAIVSTRKTIRV